MRYAAEFRRCLEECDLSGARRIMAHVMPHLKLPKTDAETLMTIHTARTASNSIAFRLRAYSHRWLLDHGLTSQLPDELKPRAERIYPAVSPAVGIAVGFNSPDLRPAGILIRGAMSDAVMDCYEDGRIFDSPFVKERMNEAGSRERKKLFGRWMR